MLKGKQVLTSTEASGFAIHAKAENEDKAHILSSLSKWVDTKEVKLDSIDQVDSLLYDVERELANQYLNEYEMIIQFQLIIVQLANTLRQQKQKWLMKFITEKTAELFVMGIHIDVPKGGSLDQRFSVIIEQLQTLPPQQQTMFNLLRDQYNKELREKELVDM